LELPIRAHKTEDEDFAKVVVLGSGDRQIAFLVDEILQEQEVVVKSLGKQLLRVSCISGATLLGSGKVVPVLNVSDLIKSAVSAGPAPLSGTQETGTNVQKTKKQKLLVVEDSITARTLIRNILETVGYDVKTAVDGIDAFTQLRSDAFDLVVSDVDMPRMNGFDLTKKIRADKKLTDLPVILVTALESKEDRERGMDAGANAYIVKRNFDQSNLLEVIKKLI
jgi:two-component system chemotaxis sensor kinase CheA